MLGYWSYLVADLHHFHRVDPWSVFDLGWRRFLIFCDALNGREGSVWAAARSASRYGPGASRDAIEASDQVVRARSAEQLEAQFRSIDSYMGV